MKIKFKLENEQEITILNGDKIIGRIFIPSGTGWDRRSAIQVCGLSDIFEYWGCGWFGDSRAENFRGNRFT